MFYLNGSSRKTHYWAVDNPKIIDQSKVEFNPRIMVWAAIWDIRIIGPFFIEGLITSYYLISAIF